MKRALAICFAMLFAAASSPTFAGTTNAVTAPPIRDMVGLDQNIGAQLPMDASFRDPTGRATTLGDVIHDRPVVLMFGYFTCPQLCGVTLDGTLEALRQVEPTVGRDYDLVYVSIDPDDTPDAAREKRDEYARRYGRGPELEGWHFLTGTAATIARVAKAAGFRFQPVAGRQRIFAHASGFIVVRPDGVVSQYFPGVDFRPAAVAAALRAAAAGETGNKVFDLLLVCFSGGLRPGIARWAFLSLQIACGLTVASMAVGISRMLRAERRTMRKQEEGSR